ncbi:immunity 26/phosphotriesterase HocA family protein [Paenibacillus sp. PK1-4R]|uniref:immunity 26/phosphotriesterase HocA family protein n=1 Tax=Paenibacillus sp. PK1-4R TaxID=3049075 RepID=UPI0025A06F27|nr:immunity 26/phosphotriesterase HocA family protein [Paenibacillus sp. PK1-4R]WJM09063.1 immunity 26/phosphotriesterase HocA family protein [Paenibacillus sp. PK1-4R]
MRMRTSYNEGDVFLIPMKDGRFAVCQVVCALKGRFKKAFSFGVMSIQRDETERLEDGDFLVCSFGQRKSNVIFTSPKLLKDGTWRIIGNIPLTPTKKELQVFQCSGEVYNGDEYIRMIPPDEYKQYISLSVAGFELVQNHLLEMSTNK